MTTEKAIKKEFILTSKNPACIGQGQHLVMNKGKGPLYIHTGPDRKESQPTAIVAEDHHLPLKTVGHDYWVHTEEKVGKLLVYTVPIKEVTTWERP